MALLPLFLSSVHSTLILPKDPPTLPPKSSLSWAVSQTLKLLFSFQLANSLTIIYFNNASVSEFSQNSGEENNIDIIIKICEKTETLAKGSFHSTGQ